jgi:hypothetical protein
MIKTNQRSLKKCEPVACFFTYEITLPESCFLVLDAEVEVRQHVQAGDHVANHLFFVTDEDDK